MSSSLQSGLRGEGDFSFGPVTAWHWQAFPKHGGNRIPVPTSLLTVCVLGACARASRAEKTLTYLQDVGGLIYPIHGGRTARQ